MDLAPTPIYAALVAQRGDPLTRYRLPTARYRPLPDLVAEYGPCCCTGGPCVGADIAQPGPADVCPVCVYLDPTAGCPANTAEEVGTDA